MKRNLALLLVTLTLGGALSAHPAHVTLAQVDYNPEAQRLEVALRIDPADLALALGGAKPATRLDDSELAALVRRHFRVTTGGEALPVRWLGSEVEVGAAWLYFELPMPERARRLSIENSLLLDRHERQVNTVNVRAAGAVTTLHLTRERPGSMADLPEP